MKYTDKFFRFPVRLYLTKDVETEELLGKDPKESPEHVIGWEYIDIEDIRGYGTIFSRYRELDDVRENGFDCTLVYLRYGKEIGCCWSPKKFEEKLNDFYEKKQTDKI